jgi:tRNA (guanine-N7-)-methyltransferase
MPFVNQYIEKVENHEKIFNEEKDLYGHKWEWKKFFWSENELWLEIGTGFGNYFGHVVPTNPNKNFLWMEIKYKRLIRTAEKTLQKWAENFQLLKDFWQNVKKIFADKELERTFIFFPDPWPKDKHAKHRLLQAPFLKDLYDITKNGWKLIYKTDYRPYFDEVINCIEEEWIWKIDKISYDYENELKEIHDTKILTEFEVIFRNKDVKINYVELIKEEK